MPLAVLSIDLEAKMARFEADMGRASRSLEKLANDAKSSFSGVGAVFAGSLAAGAVEQGLRSLLNLFPRLIEGVAAFKDLSEVTGASAVGLASFQTAADVSGVSVQDLAGLMVRLTGNLSKLTDEGKGAGAGLKALGLELSTFKALTPDQQITTLAETFAKFEDGSGKTAVALALFGKQGAQVIKFFNEYQSQGGAVVRLTAEQIAQADDYADAQARMRSNLMQTAQIIAVQALPAITALGEGFRTGVVKILGFQTATQDLKADSAILDAMEGAAIAVATVGEALTGVIKIARTVAGSFQAVAADIALPFKVAYAAAGVLDGKTIAQSAVDVAAAFQNRNVVVSEASARYVDLLTYDGTAVTTALRKSFAAQRIAINADQSELARMRERAANIAGGKPMLNLIPPVDVANNKAADDAFAKFMAQISERRALAQGELDTNQKLSDSDRFRLDTLNKLDERNNALSVSQKDRIRSKLDEAVTVLKLNESQQERLKLMTADSRATGQQLQQQDDINRKLQDQNAEIGLNTEQLEKLAIARLSATQALDAERIAVLAMMGATAEDLAQRRLLLDEKGKEIELRKQSQALLSAEATTPLTGANRALDDFLTKAKESGTATRAAANQGITLLEDDLTSSLRNGSLTVSRTVDFMINEFLRLAVVKPLLSSLFSGVSLSSVFGFLGGAPVKAAANGAAFSPTAVIPFAAGGIFDSPHLFKFAQGGAMATGVLGEAGPEAILPLSRGPGGKLGVRAQGGGGGGVQIVQHINIGDGASINQVKAAMQQTKQETLAAVADMQRRAYARQGY